MSPNSIGLQFQNRQPSCSRTHVRRFVFLPQYLGQGYGIALQPVLRISCAELVYDRIKENDVVEQHKNGIQAIRHFLQA